MTRRVRALLLAAAAVATLANVVPARAGGDGITRGTADIRSTEGFAGDGRTYVNSQGDEVSFGERGVFGSNYFFLQAGSSRSSRYTVVDHPTPDIRCIKTIFTVSSPDGNVDWFTDGDPEPSYGQARLICDAENRHRYEFRWGYGAENDCVEIAGTKVVGFRFEALPECTATFEESFKSQVVNTSPAVELPFMLDARPNVT